MNIIKRHEANRLPSVFDDMFKTDWLGGTTNVNRIGTSIPAVNIQETEGNFIVAVAAPGKKKEDFKIELDNEILTISCEQKTDSDNEENYAKFTRREFNYGSFKRVFSLPETVNSVEISASYNNGVLEINLPKREEAKIQPKRMIDIS